VADPLKEKANEIRTRYQSEDDDDALLEEWDAAVSTMRRRAPASRVVSGVGEGNPLADTSKAEEVEDVRDGFAMRVGRVDPATHRGDSYGYLETPLSDMARTLGRTDPDAPEYQRVKDLYGPARIAYHRKNNLDINTGKPKQASE
jgi:hypothetical protein